MTYKKYQNRIWVISDVDDCAVSVAMLSNREPTETVAGVIEIWSPFGHHRREKKVLTSDKICIVNIFNLLPRFVNQATFGMLTTVENVLLQCLCKKHNDVISTKRGKQSKTIFGIVK